MSLMFVVLTGFTAFVLYEAILIWDYFFKEEGSDEDGLRASGPWD